MSAFLAIIFLGQVAGLEQVWIIGDEFSAGKPHVS